MHSVHVVARRVGTATYRISNIIGTLHFDRPVPKELWEKIGRPIKRFPAGKMVTFKEHPTVKALVFISMKANIVGARDFEELLTVAAKLVDLLRRHGFDTKYRLEVVNVVAGFDLGQPVSLEEVFEKLSERGFDVYYEPEHFLSVEISIPGGNPSLKALLYSKGRGSIVGARSPEEVELAVRFLAREVLGSGA